MARKFFGPDLPHLNDLAYNMSLLLVNSHFSLHQARPTVPNFVEVAGLHIRDPKPLPEVKEHCFEIRIYVFTCWCCRGLGRLSKKILKV